MSYDMQNRLQSYCATAFPTRQEMQVSDMTAISSGWESDIYTFAIEHGPAGGCQREELILRIYPADDAYDKSGHEFHGMSQLHEAGYPVPQVLILERENSPFGKPFVIMERIKGQVLWPLMFGSPQEKQRELLTLFCELFVQLHTLEWRSFDYPFDQVYSERSRTAQDKPFDRAQDKPFVHDVARYDTGDPYAFVDGWLELYRSYLALLPSPGFLAVIEWLEAQRDQSPCSRPALIHLDYHPENVLLRDDGSAVVIDWTQLDISDPRFDLAWTLVLVSSSEGVEWRHRILQEYERLAGASVEQITYFEVAACAKRLGSVVLSLSYGPEKLGMRPDAATMMQQQMGALKRVYDLLLERTGIRVAEVEELFASLS